MTDPGLVLRRLAALQEQAARVRARYPGSPDSLAQDSVLADALAMSLLVAVQEAVDICFHIVADEGWGLPASYTDGFRALADHGIVDAELARQLGQLASLRNRLVHGYASVDLARLWQELPGGLEALARYGQAVARFLDAEAHE